MARIGVLCRPRVGRRVRRGDGLGRSRRGLPSSVRRGRGGQGERRREGEEGLGRAWDTERKGVY